MEYIVDSWTDCLGQNYRAGDAVAYASISGRSPQLVIGEVMEIRTHDTQGRRVKNYRGEESCKVKIQPLLDARDFYRSYEAKPVWVSIAENIIKVPNELKPKSKAERDREQSEAGVLEILKELARD